MAVTTPKFDMDNDTSSDIEPTPHPYDNEYYGILIIVAIFFGVFAFAAVVYLRQRGLRLYAYQSDPDRPVPTVTDPTSANHSRLPRRSTSSHSGGARALSPLDVLRLAPPSYDDLPPSYEDSVKERGVINMGFASEEGVREAPPPYDSSERIATNPSSSTSPSGVETSVQTCSSSLPQTTSLSDMSPGGATVQSEDTAMRMSSNGGVNTSSVTLSRNNPNETIYTQVYTPSSGTPCDSDIPA